MYFYLIYILEYQKERVYLDGSAHHRRQEIYQEEEEAKQLWIPVQGQLH